MRVAGHDGHLLHEGLRYKHAVERVAVEEGQVHDAAGVTPFHGPHRLVTANESCVRRKAGCLRDNKLREIRDRVCAFVMG